MARSILVLAFLALLALPAGTGSPEHRERERPAGTLVFSSESNRLTAIDAATGRRTGRQIAEVAACGPEMHVTGGRLVFAGLVRGRTVVFSIPLTLDRAPARLGAAHAFVPSATPGRVWLAGRDCDRTTMSGVREVTVDGLVMQESRRRVPGTWLEAAVAGGLVVVQRRGLVVWDPRTGRTLPLALDGVVAAHGNLVAGCTRQTRCRDLVIEDAATLAAVEPHVEFGGAVFSPGGSLVATPVLSRRRWSIVLVDTHTGKVTPVPGSRVRHWPELSWATSSGWLFARSGRRLLAYRPGMARAVALPFKAPRGAYAFVAG